eukprot:snap_masked-scaffold_12-processed-gene-10.30-mRNA-1 protein AED:1.00 eAED:1.00 QI:0/0/0/0/1/1/2/0/80
MTDELPNSVNTQRMVKFLSINYPQIQFDPYLSHGTFQYFRKAEYLETKAFDVLCLLLGFLKVFIAETMHLIVCDILSLER